MFLWANSQCIRLLQLFLATQCVESQVGARYESIAIARAASPTTTGVRIQYVPGTVQKFLVVRRIRIVQRVRTPLRQHGRTTNSNLETMTTLPQAAPNTTDEDRKIHRVKRDDEKRKQG